MMFAAKKRIPFPARQTISNLHQRTWAVMRTEAKDSFSHYFLQCALREKPTCLLCLYISLLVHHSPPDLHSSYSDCSSFRSLVSTPPPHLISIHPDSAICAHKPITIARGSCLIRDTPAPHTIAGNSSKGSQTWNALPPSGQLSAQIRPRCNATRCLQTVSPNPRPYTSRVRRVSTL